MSLLPHVPSHVCYSPVRPSAPPARPSGQTGCCTCDDETRPSPVNRGNQCAFWLKTDAPAPGGQGAERGAGSVTRAAGNGQPHTLGEQVGRDDRDTGSALQ